MAYSPIVNISTEAEFVFGDEGTAREPERGTKCDPDAPPSTTQKARELDEEGRVKHHLRLVV